MQAGRLTGPGSSDPETRRWPRRTRHRRRRLRGGPRSRTGSAPIRRRACWCSRRGGPTTAWDVFIHMPAALAFPIGNRYYDWKYESEPEPHMNGRADLPRARQGARRLQSINGMIFQRGNPLDYERWAADPGMEGWDYAHCLPYFKRMETCLAGADDEFRGDDGPLVLERGPGDEPALPGVLRGGPAGRLSADRRRQRLPAGGIRAVRPQHPPRPPAERGPRLPASRDAADRTSRCAPARSSTRVLFDGTRAVGVEVSATAGPRAGRGRRGHPLRRRDQLAAAAAGLGRRERRELEALGIAVVARPPGGRRAPAGPPRGLHPARLHAAGLRGAGDEVANRPWIGLQWLFFRAAPARRTTSRPAGSSAATTTWPTRT